MLEMKGLEIQHMEKRQKLEVGHNTHKLWNMEIKGAPCLAV